MNALLALDGLQKALKNVKVGDRDSKAAVGITDFLSPEQKTAGLEQTHDDGMFCRLDEFLFSFDRERYIKSIIKSGPAIQVPLGILFEMFSTCW